MYDSKPKTPTVDQLRIDIDRGRTGEKVEGADPAAAPLGTDEEAAGTPVAPAQIAQARRTELSMRSDPPKLRFGLGATWVHIGFSAMLLIGLALALLFHFGWL
jgi:hypothetical protein